MCTKQWLQEGLIKSNSVARPSKLSFCCLVIFYLYNPFIICLYPLFTVSVYLLIFCKHNLNRWSPTQGRSIPYSHPLCSLFYYLLQWLKKCPNVCPLFINFSIVSHIH